MMVDSRGSPSAGVIALIVTVVPRHPLAVKYVMGREAQGRPKPEPATRSERVAFRLTAVHPTSDLLNPNAADQPVVLSQDLPALPRESEAALLCMPLGAVRGRAVRSAAVSAVLSH